MSSRSKFFQVIFITIIYCTCVYSCKKATFSNTILKLSLDEFGEFSKFENFTGCISPLRVTEKIVTIECYNQSLPFLREGAITNMHELKTLIFMGNTINKIMWATFIDLPQLEELILSKNKIKTIDVGVFSVLPSIATLNLNGNQITYLGHGIFSNMPNLRILRLYDNQLDTIEEQWFDVNSNLSILDMSYNLIRRVPRNAFTSVKNLEIIDLSHNRILTVDESAMEGLTTLLQLDLSENRIFQLTGDVFSPLVNLDILHLHGNNLTYIHDQVLEGISYKLQEISIYSNPWQCACYDNIMKWVRSRTSKLRINSSLNCVLQLSPICVFPLENSDKCLEDVDEELDSMFYEAFRYTNKTCELDFSHP